jgi:hypothetical protein
VKERNKNFKALNEELRKKFENTEHKQEVSRRKVKEFKEKCDEHLTRYESMYKDLVRQYEEAQVQISNSVNSA